MLSDGSRFLPTKGHKYYVYEFSNNSLDIHSILQSVCDKQGIKYSFRKGCRNSYITGFRKNKEALKLDEFVGPKS